MVRPLGRRRSGLLFPLALASACAPMPFGAEPVSHSTVMSTGVPDVRPHEAAPELAKVVEKAQAAASRGDIREAQELLKSSLAEIRRLSVPSLSLRALNLLGQLLIQSGNNREAHLYVAEAQDVLTHHATELMAKDQARTLFLVGAVAQLDGRTNDARRAYERAVSLAGEGDTPLVVALAEAALAEMYRAEANLGAAKERYRAALVAAQQAQAEPATELALLALVQIHETLEEYPEAVSYTQALIEIYKSKQRLQDLARHTLHLARMLATLSRFTEAERTYLHAGELANRLSDDELMADALSGLAQAVYYATGRNVDALRTLNELRTLFAKGRRTDRLAQIDEITGFVLRDLGRHQDALAAFGRAYEGHKGAQHYVGEAIALKEVGKLLIAQGQVTQGLQALQEAVRLTTERGADYVLATILTEAGESLLLADFAQTAEDYLNRALALADRPGFRNVQAKALHALARLRGAQDRSAEAVTLYQRAATLYEATGDRQGLVVVQLHVYPDYFALGRVREALQSVHRAVDEAQSLGDPRREAAALQAVAQAYRWVGDGPSEILYLQRALRRLTENGDVKGIILTRKNLARAYREGGNFYRAQEEAEQAVRLARGGDYLSWLQLAQYELFNVYQATRDSRAGAVFLEMCSPAQETAPRGPGELCASYAPLIALSFPEPRRSEILQAYIDLREFDLKTARDGADAIGELRALSGMLTSLALLGREATINRYIARIRTLLEGQIAPEVQFSAREQLAATLGYFRRTEEECTERRAMAQFQAARAREFEEPDWRAGFVGQTHAIYDGLIKCLFALNQARKIEDMALAYEALEVHDRSQAQGLLQVIQGGRRPRDLDALVKVQFGGDRAAGAAPS